MFFKGQLNLSKTGNNMYINCCVYDMQKEVFYLLHMPPLALCRLLAQIRSLAYPDCVPI